MWDPNQFRGTIEHFFPLVALLAGLSGSFHCLGMCGGLVAASCQNRKNIFEYQFGRLIGYLILGWFSGLFGPLLHFKDLPSHYMLFPGAMMGILFIYWGIRELHIFKFNFQVALPLRLEKIYFHLWSSNQKIKSRTPRSFLTGLISIFLPCGLLYSMALAAALLGNPIYSAISLFSFWLGTLPAMALAPQLLNKFLTPLKINLPRAYAIGLIGLGLMTVGSRAYQLTHIKSKISQQNGKQIDLSNTLPAKDQAVSSQTPVQAPMCH